MSNIAPNITRQRLLIEGYFTITVDEKIIEQYFSQVTDQLSLRTYGKPIIFSPAGMGKSDNQGYDAFIPLIDSGISLYIWTAEKFLSLIIYTCKSFDEKQAIECTKDFFKLTEQFEAKRF
jgi:S-adenosylmethionine decarboxylase